MSKQTRHAVYNINYHLVWTPKYRRKILVGAIAERLHILIPEIAERLGGEVLELVIQPDHVHLFASFPPTLSVAQIMHRIKGATSHQLREEFPELRSRLPAVWTRTYYIGTAGHVSTETIKRYIEEQKRS